MIASLSEEIEEAKIEKASETAGNNETLVTKKKIMNRFKTYHEDISKIVPNTIYDHGLLFISR